MRSIWLQEEIEFLLQNINLPTKDLYLAFCGEFGNSRTYDSIQKKIFRLKSLSIEEDEEMANINETLEDMELTAEVNDLLNVSPIITGPTQERKKILKQEAKLWLENLIEESNKLPHSVSISPVQSTEASLVVAISDTHIGKQNANFNTEIASKRILELPILINQKENQRIDEIVLTLVGDIIEGEDIFPTQAHHIECSVIDQIQIATDALWKSIVTFRNTFNCPVRIETVPGNHGRVSKSASERSNWDNVLYHTLRVIAINYNDPYITVNTNFDQFHTIKIKDKKVLLYHYGVKHIGTPAMREKIAGWVFSKDFDVMIAGHWHEWYIGNWMSRIIVSNGCLCGPDDLAERMGKEDKARQAYFFIKPSLTPYGFGTIEWDFQQK